MIIFDESVQYDNLIKNGFEKYPNKRDLTILGKKWMLDGATFDEILDKMIVFCKQFNSQFCYAKNENLFLNVIKSLKDIQNGIKSYEFNKKIEFCGEEIEKIKGIPEKNIQKVLFVIACLAKWRKANFIYLNSGSSIKVSDIFNFAHIKSSKRERYKILYELNKRGYIDVALKPLLKVWVPVICENIEDKQPQISFTINDDMINEWLKLVNPLCERCHKPFEKKNNKQKYCKDCANVIHKEQKLKSWHIRQIEKI